MVIINYTILMIWRLLEVIIVLYKYLKNIFKLMNKSDMKTLDEIIIRYSDFGTVISAHLLHVFVLRSTKSATKISLM